MQTIYGRHLEPETLVQNARIITDGGTIVDSFWINQIIRTLKAQGVYTSCKFLGDANMAYKNGGSGLVSTLYDFSGNNNDGIGVTTTRPTWTATQQGTRAGIVFDGSDDYLSLGATIFASNAAFTIITAVIPSVVNNNNMRILDITNGGAGTWFGMDPYVGNLFNLNIFDGDAVSVSTTTAALAATPYIITARYDGAKGYICFNGTEEANDTNGYTGGGTIYMIMGRYGTGGGAVGAGDALNGKILFTVIFNASITTAQRQAVEAVINNYYAIY